jgi:hypothetical protein
VAAQNKKQKIDLEGVARRLGKITRLLPAAGTPHSLLRATLAFDTATFESGEYRVSIGIKKATLLIEHPGYDIDRPYSATLAKEHWSENWTRSDKSQFGGRLKLAIGALFSGTVKANAQVSGNKERNETVQQKGKLPYPIVTPTPRGWQIGTERGDPRDPHGSLPSGLEGCLFGEYLTGRNGEEPDKTLSSKSPPALCELHPKHNANDPHITALLLTDSNSIEVVVSRSREAGEPKAPLPAMHDRAEAEKRLREAFISISIQRTDAAHKSEPMPDDIVTGEYLLHRDKKLGPGIDTKTVSITKSKEPPA